MIFFSFTTIYIFYIGNDGGLIPVFFLLSSHSRYPPHPQSLIGELRRLESPPMSSSPLPFPISSRVCLSCKRGGLGDGGGLSATLGRLLKTLA